MLEHFAMHQTWHMYVKKNFENAQDNTERLATLLNPNSWSQPNRKAMKSNTEFSTRTMATVFKRTVAKF